MKVLNYRDTELDASVWTKEKAVQVNGVKRGNKNSFVFNESSFNEVYQGSPFLNDLGVIIELYPSLESPHLEAIVHANGLLELFFYNATPLNLRGSKNKNKVGIFVSLEVFDDDDSSMDSKTTFIFIERNKPFVIRAINLGVEPNIAWNVEFFEKTI